MTNLKMILAGAAGLAAFAAATPASAQYYYGSQYYGSPYGYAYGYNNTQALASRCTAAVQQRLNTRGNTGILSILGIRTGYPGRVLSVTRVNPRQNTVRVRGLATSNAYAAYGPYGVGAYGALGYGYAQPRADLSYTCDIDYRGYIRDIDINRR